MRLSFPGTVGDCDNRSGQSCWVQIFVLGLAQVAFLQPALPQIEVAYDVTNDGLLVVDTFVEGEGPYPFLIDTGASTSVLSERLHETLKSRAQEAQSSRIHGVAESGIFPSVTLQSIKVGEVEIRPVQVSVMPSAREEPEWEGILSLDFFEGRIVLFETAKQRLTLFPASDEARTRFSGWRKLNAYRDENLTDFPFIFFQAKFVTDYYLGGRRVADQDSVEVLLDLGSSVPILNWSGAKYLGYGETYRRLENQWRVAGAVGSFQPKAMIPKQEIVVARKRWTTPVLIFDTPPLELIGREDKPFMYFSSAFFEATDFAIDFDAPEIYLSPH